MTPRLAILLSVMVALLGSYAMLMSGPFPSSEQVEKSSRAVRAHCVPLWAGDVRVSYSWGQAHRTRYIDRAQWMRHMYFTIKYVDMHGEVTRKVHVAVDAGEER